MAYGTAHHLPSRRRADDPGPLALENAELRARLEEAEDTLHALRQGEVDAIVVGDDVYTLEATEAIGNRLRSDVLAQMQDAVIAFDAAGHVIHINPAAERLYGQRASQVLGRPSTALFRQEWLDPADAAAAERAMDEQGLWRGRSRHVAAAGRLLLVDSTLSRLRDGNGAVTGTLAVVSDVSERAAAEAALRESRAQLQFTLDSARIGAWDLDLATDAARRSLRHDQCFGYAEPVARWGLTELLAHVHADDRRRVEETFRTAIAARGELHLECRVVWPDRSLHWIEMHGSVFDALGAPLRMIGIVSDITERKAAESALRDADQRKDEFLATLAHELRNPLAPIRNSLQTMRLSQDGPVHDRAQAVIERQLAQMVHLVDDLLDVSRISQGKIELRRQRVDIALVVRNAVDTSLPLIEAKGQRLVLELPHRAVTVEADVTRLTQVVANLLNNAAKYTPPGGCITLHAETAGPQVRVTVRDTGMGISADMLPRVFDLFTQVNNTLERAQGGLGIGLALVKRLVEMHGGSVDGRSDGEGRGSCFTVHLPLAADAGPARASDAAADEGAAAASRRVLVVDDNRDGAESLSLMLQFMGHVTATALDGPEALRLAESFQPELVLLDIGLPGMNGYEVARRLRATPAGAALTLVALTGWGQDADRERSRQAGFDHHCVKPIDVQWLTEMVAQVAAGPAAG